MSYYLLEYPPAERPKIAINGFLYEVMAVSEVEARFKGSRPKPQICTNIDGIILFADGPEQVCGSVICVSDRVNVLLFETGKGLSFKRIMKEQLRIFAKYGKTRK